MYRVVLTVVGLTFMAACQSSEPQLREPVEIVDPIYDLQPAETVPQAI